VGMRLHDRAVDEEHLLSLAARVGAEHAAQRIPSTCDGPAAIASVDAIPAPVLLGKIPPRCTRPKNPSDGLYEPIEIALRSTAHERRGARNDSLPARIIETVAIARSSHAQTKLATN
jgi:hypothetical protein